MLFLDFSLKLEEISSLSSRNEIVKKLAELFHKSNEKEIQEIIYLLSGRVTPPYENVEFNIGRNTVISAISISLSEEKEKIKDLFNEKGDLGEVFKALKLETSSEYEVGQVFEALSGLTAVNGKGAVQRKLDIIVNLLNKLSPVEGKYLIKIILDELRLGFSTKTILDALSWELNGTKEFRKTIERAYSVVSDLGYIARYLKINGVEGLENISITPGIPLFAKLVSHVKDAQEIVERMGSAYIQPKYDGIRCQIHVYKENGETQVRIYSRNLENMTNMFPEITNKFAGLKLDNVILDGEVIGYNPITQKYLFFQETTQRRRKYGIEEFSNNYPMVVFLFDMLFCNGTDITISPLTKRLDMLKKFVNGLDNISNIKLTETREYNNADDIELFLKDQLGKGLEGLVAKDPQSIYKPGTRNYDWVKLKRANIVDSSVTDTFDLVVLGYYNGYGSRALNGIGGLLMGIYNKDKDEYQSIAKVGSGIKDSEWKIIKEDLDNIKVLDKLPNVNVNKNLYPSVWVQPKIICVVKADEITKSPIHTAGKTEKNLGYALRFPRLVIFKREDKNAEDTTTVAELSKI